MAKQNTNHLKLGVFVTAGLVLLIIGIYNVGSRQSMFAETIQLSAVFGNVQGLQSGNNVRFNGINVGNVSSIEFKSDTSIQVNFEINIEAAGFVHKDAIATISSDGLVGNMILSIDPGNRNLPIVESGDEIKSYSRISSNDMLNTLNVTNENAALLTSDLLKITEKILNERGTFRMLLTDTILTENILKTSDNIRISSQTLVNTSYQLTNLVSKLNEGEGLIKYLTEDSSAVNQLSQMMQGLEHAGLELKQTATTLSQYMQGLKDAEGAINTLAYDSAMANDLKESLRNINQGTARFNENMEAMKHNFLFKKYFKKKSKEQSISGIENE